MSRQQLEQKLKSFQSRDVIATITLLCIFGYLFTDRMYSKTAQEASDVKIALITLATLVLTYYFGASKGKTDTDERQSIQMQQPTQPTIVQNVEEQNVDQQTVGK